MKLEIEGERVRRNPSLDEIEKALASLNGRNSSFAILERDKLMYIQASGPTANGFSLEYQDGSLKEHFECPVDLPLEEVIKVFQAYALGGDQWRTSCNWTPMDVRASGFSRRWLFVPLVFAALAVTAGVLASTKSLEQRLGLVLFVACLILFVASVFVIRRMVYPGLRLERPRIDTSPLAICAYSAMGLGFVAVFLGSQKGADRSIWMTLFLISAATFAAAGTTRSLLTGVFGGDSFRTTRADSPIQFWFSVVMGYATSVGILALGILVLLKRI